jgi:hypothetical protein
LRHARHDAALLRVAQAERLGHDRDDVEPGILLGELGRLGLALRRRTGYRQLAVHEYVNARARRVRAGLFGGVLLRFELVPRIGRLLGGRDADAQAQIEDRRGERQMDEAHGRNS